MRTKTTQTYDNGQLVESVDSPWTRWDYLQAIAEVEATITNRRMREAIAGVEGAAEWIAGRESEIATLRSEMNAL